MADEEVLAAKMEDLDGANSACDAAEALHGAGTPPMVLGRHSTHTLQTIAARSGRGRASTGSWEKEEEEEKGPSAGGGGNELWGPCSSYTRDPCSRLAATVLSPSHACCAQGAAAGEGEASAEAAPGPAEAEGDLDLDLSLKKKKKKKKVRARIRLHFAAACEHGDAWNLAQRCNVVRTAHAQAHACMPPPMSRTVRKNSGTTMLRAPLHQQHQLGMVRMSWRMRRPRLASTPGQGLSATTPTMSCWVSALELAACATAQFGACACSCRGH